MGKVKAIELNVGADMSKKSFSICITIRDENSRIKIVASKKFDNTKPGIEKFFEYVRLKNKWGLPVRITVEATGVYHEHLCYKAYGEGYEVLLIPGRRINQYAKSLVGDSKTDKKDAAVLGRYGLERVEDEKVWDPGDTKVLKLKRQCREYGQIKKTLTAEKNRLAATDSSFEPDAELQKRQQERIEFLESHKKQVIKAIKEFVKTEKVVEKNMALLTSIPGVGEITAAIIIAETDNFAGITSISQLVSYAGYDVIKKQSGSSVNKPTRMSKKGNAHIRGALYFPAVQAIQINPVFKSLRDRVFVRSKVKMKALVAVQRKLLCIMFAVVKNQKPYDMQYHMSQASHGPEALQKAIKEEFNLSMDQFFGMDKNKEMVTEVDVSLPLAKE